MKIKLTRACLYMLMGMLTSSCISRSDELLSGNSVKKLTQKRENTQTKNGVSNCIRHMPVSAIRGLTNSYIAQVFAPILYQDVDTTDCREKFFSFLCPKPKRQSEHGAADWITAVNYDGDWIGINNWDNLVRERSKGNLKAVVYYTVNETDDHLYILYSIFHPRDWDDTPISYLVCKVPLFHENDMEGILLSVLRDGNGLGNVEFVSTIFHKFKPTHQRDEVAFSGKRAKIFIESKGHGIREYMGPSDKDHSYITYVYSNSNTQPSGKYPSTEGYKLVSSDILWEQRNNNNLFKGNSFKGDDGKHNAANAPWGWGKIATDPAAFINSSISNKHYSTHYLRKRPLQRVK